MRFLQEKLAQDKQFVYHIVFRWQSDFRYRATQTVSHSTSFSEIDKKWKWQYTRRCCLASEYFEEKFVILLTEQE